MEWLNEYLHDVKGVSYDYVEDVYDYLEEYADETVVDEIVGHRRWDVDKRMVLRFGRRYVEVVYSVGATEYQDYNSEREFREVFPKVVEKTIYTTKRG